MDYLLDTNMLIIYSRETVVANNMEAEFNFFNNRNRLAISSVTLGELDSLTKQFKIGEKRKQKLLELLEYVFIIDINFPKIINRYGDIDAYSQGKLNDVKPTFSARNMGKNDLWIAATASIYELTLVTTDKDFSHLNHTYLELLLINSAKYK